MSGDVSQAPLRDAQTPTSGPDGSPSARGLHLQAAQPIEIDPLHATLPRAEGHGARSRRHILWPTVARICSSSGEDLPESSGDGSSPARRRRVPVREDSARSCSRDSLQSSHAPRARPVLNAPFVNHDLELFRAPWPQRLLKPSAGSRVVRSPVSTVVVGTGAFCQDVIES